jgi:hypothetical protein
MAAKIMFSAKWWEGGMLDGGKDYRSESQQECIPFAIIRH